MHVKDKLRILVDSISIDRILSSSSKRAKNLFKYIQSNTLEFVRTPEPVESDCVQQIIQFKKKA